MRDRAAGARRGLAGQKHKRNIKSFIDMIQLFVCRTCLLIQFDLSSSKLTLKIFLCSQAGLPHVTAPSCHSMCWSLSKLLLLGKARVQSYSLFLDCNFPIQENWMLFLKLFIMFKHTHKGRIINEPQWTHHSPSIIIDILQILFHLSSQLCCFCFSWNILKHN